MTVESALTIAILAALRAADAVPGDRVYDEVPTGAALPYVAIRSLQTVDDGSDCIDGFEVFVDLDVWSRANSKLEATTIAGAVRDALHDANLTTADPFALLEIMHRDTVIDRSDGIHTRARMTFLARLERV